MAAIITKEELLINLQDHIAEMPPLSATVTKLMNICNNPRTSPDDLIRVISLDPVLTGKVLSLVNSAYYSLSKRADSLSRAIILLGMNTVTNIALNTSVLKSIGAGDSFKTFSMDNFWYHSLCVGVTAKTLTMLLDTPLKDREVFFFAGLLHDLGKIPLYRCYPDEHARVLASVTRKKETSCRVEDALFGFNHCMVGDLVAEKWHLGPALHSSICHHHIPSAAAEDNRQVTALVALGNIYANHITMGASCASRLADDLMDQTGISWTALCSQEDTILAEIEKAKIFLEL